MRVLVTGGAGFIGSHVVEALLAQGQEVVVLDSLVTGKPEHVPAPARLIVADVREAPASAAIRALAPEVLVHLAAQMDVRKSVADPAHDVDVNLRGLCQVMEAARPSVRFVAFASSGGAMYGEQDVFPADEEHPVRPTSPYGLAKAVGEQYLAWYGRTYGIPAACLRLGNVYGPRQDPHGEAGVVAIFAQRMLAGQPVTVFGDGEQTRDYVYVGDVVKALLAAVEARCAGSFNVGTGVETSVNTLAAAMSRALALPAVVHRAPARVGEQVRSCISPQRLEQALGVAPRTTLDQGLVPTMQYFVARHRQQQGIK